MTHPPHSPGYYVHFARLAHRTGRNYLREGRTGFAEEAFERSRSYVWQARQALFEELCATPDRVLYPQEQR